MLLFLSLFAAVVVADIHRQEFSTFALENWTTFITGYMLTFTVCTSSRGVSGFGALCCWVLPGTFHTYKGPAAVVLLMAKHLAALELNRIRPTY